MFEHLTPDARQMKKNHPALAFGLEIASENPADDTITEEMEENLKDCTPEERAILLKNWFLK